MTGVRSASAGLGAARRTRPGTRRRACFIHAAVTERARGVAQPAGEISERYGELHRSCKLECPYWKTATQCGNEATNCAVGQEGSEAYPYVGLDEIELAAARSGDGSSLASITVAPREELVLGDVSF